MSNEETREPEWDLFGRLEKAEEAYKEIQNKASKLEKVVMGVQPTLEELTHFAVDITDLLKDVVPLARDANSLAKDAFWLACTAHFIPHPDKARRTKDILMGRLKSRGLNAKTMEELDRILLDLCDWVEGK